MSNNQTPQGAIAHRLIRRTQLQDQAGISRSTIYARLDPKSPQYDPDFPTPIQLSPNSTSIAWVEAEVQAYIAKRIEASRKVGVDDVRKARIAARRKTAGA